MHFDFDDNVPVSEQMLRTAARKRKGRKHQHKPGNLASKKQQQVINVKAHKMRLRKFYNAKVSAYWRGEKEDYPS